MIRSVQRFYVCSYDNICECGVECGEMLQLPSESNLGILRIQAGQYAVLPDDCLGNIRMGGVKIDIWLTNNSIA